jgi:hypothetical protein
MHAGPRVGYQGTDRGACMGPGHCSCHRGRGQQSALQACAPSCQYGAVGYEDDVSCREPPAEHTRLFKWQQLQHTLSIQVCLHVP